MQVGFSSEATKKLAVIRRKDKKLFQRIEKHLLLFQKNSKHPSLRTHKLTGNLDNRWSISINKSIRMVYIVKERDVVVFVTFGTHEEVYGK